MLRSGERAYAKNQNRKTMKKTYLPTTITALVLTLVSLTLPLVSNVHAADIFTKVMAGPGSDPGNSRGAAWGDYDNDGFIDLFVPQIGPNGCCPARHFLYHNHRDGTFSRITIGTVAEVESFGRGAVWGDYDNDGYLDLVLVNANQTNYLFHSNGDGSFAEVTSAAVVPDLANSESVTWVDYDNDGYVDIFRAAFDQPRRLHHNDRDGT